MCDTLCFPEAAHHSAIITTVQKDMDTGQRRNGLQIPQGTRTGKIMVRKAWIREAPSSL